MKNKIILDQVNRRDDRWFAPDRVELPIAMPTKFSAHVMVLGVVFSDGGVMLSYFFDHGLKVTADAYLKVLQDVVVPRMKKLAVGHHFIFQQDRIPPHNSEKTQIWLAKNVPRFWE